MNRQHAAILALDSLLSRWMVMALLLVNLSLLAGCGASSRAISIIGPSPPELVSISVAPSDTTLAAGLSQQYTATGVYSDGTKVDISSSVTWASTVSSVAVISNSGGSTGMATAISAGGTTITATFGTIAGSTTLTVTGATLVSIAVTPTLQSLPEGTPLQYTATGIYSNNSLQNLTAHVTWTSSNPSVASISTNGLANTLTAGTTTIQATLGTLSGTTTLTVITATLSSITVTPIAATIAKGSNLQYTATGHYSNNSTQNITSQVTWTSGNTTLVTISNAGFAAALAAGQTTIQATLGGISGSVPITVTSPTLVSIAITTATQTLNVNQSEPFTATGTYADGSHATITTSVTWTSSNTAYATISATGVATGVALGTPANITASLGTITSNSVTLTVVEIAYALNFDSGNSNGSISEFQIYPGGQLVALGTVVPGVKPYDIAIDSTDSYAYVVNYNNQNQGSVSEYAINADGTLTSNGSINTGDGPNGVAIDPTAAFAYVANYNGPSLSEYSITGGALAALTGSPVTAASLPASIAINVAGTYAYVANGTSPGNVYEYQIQPNGGLSPIGNIAAGNQPNSIVTTGQFVYVANLSDGTVSEYTIDPTNGSLTPIAGGPVTAGAGASSITIDAKGQNAYVTNRGAGTVEQFSIGPTGALVLQSSVSVGASNGPSSLAIDPSGQYAYVTERFATGNPIAEFSVSSTGALTPLNPATVPSTGTQPVSIITVP
jgi:6-phosphogluconolactonase (cycloisomerase 2 family)